MGFRYAWMYYKKHKTPKSPNRPQLMTKIKNSEKPKPSKMCIKFGVVHSFFSNPPVRPILATFSFLILHVSIGFFGLRLVILLSTDSCSE